MSSQQAANGRTRITLVESEACHFCEEARRSLAELAHTYPLDIHVVDVRSEEGQRLMQQHRASMSPLVLLDDDFFSHGRLPRRKLTKLLDRRRTASPAVVG